MGKTKITTVFFCQNCGYESSKWMGQCPGCRQWNTLVEETVPAASKGMGGSGKTKALGERREPSSLSAIAMQEEERVSTLLETLKNLMGNMGLTAEQSMDAMGVPKREREVLFSLL